MGSRLDGKTSMDVDSKFFDRVFEPARKKTQEKLGISNLSQANFTKMLRKSGFKFPSIKMNMKIFMPPLKKKRKKNNEKFFIM